MISDGCNYVFIDGGSNIGVQVRKLYEPEHYPGAKVLNIFDDAFGPHHMRNYSEICAIGFEPNPAHTQRLKSEPQYSKREPMIVHFERILTVLEETYSNCGYKVHFVTETAVSNTYGEMDFYRFQICIKQERDDLSLIFL